MTTGYSPLVARLTGPFRLLLLLGAAVCLPVGASAQVLYADLNGDGIHDRVDPGVRPTEIVVRLSAGHRQHRLRADSPIIRLAVVDFNRDGHPDLVAITSRPGGLMVWINHGNGRFSRHRAARPARDRLEDGGEGTARKHSGRQSGDTSDDVASRPLLVGDTAVGVDEFSYVRRVRENRPLIARFEGRSRIPRGPPSDQLF